MMLLSRIVWSPPCRNFPLWSSVDVVVVRIVAQLFLDTSHILTFRGGGRGMTSHHSSLLFPKTPTCVWSFHLALWLTALVRSEVSRSQLVVHLFVVTPHWPGRRQDLSRHLLAPSLPAPHWLHPALPRIPPGWRSAELAGSLFPPLPPSASGPPRSSFRASLTSLLDSQLLICFWHLPALDARARVRRVVELFISSLFGHTGNS